MGNRRLALLIGGLLVSMLAPVASSWAQLAKDLPWPMCQHDLLHTGRSVLPGPSALNLKWTKSGRRGDTSQLKAIGRGGARPGAAVTVT
jgi:hypothetical protein